MEKKTIIVLATKNKGKVKEFEGYFKNFPIVLKSLDDFGQIPEIVEDGVTFEENAYKKSSCVARILGFPALADDSGLVIDALNGAPGVYSARYAGENVSDEYRYKKILEEMKGKENRAARFECVLSLSVPSGKALTYEANCEGIIADAPSGSNGFGYDPIFFYPPLNKTFGQLTNDEKTIVSHRGKALKELSNELDKVLIWMRQHI
ncbi:MAG: XTP/dITP diphosphatase [Desulfobacterales bacterium]|nr:XTP/dITP diphosphatase [Desulfobacterales bacterium]